MGNKKSGEMTFKELFDLVKNDEMKKQILTLLKGEGYTETQINKMKMKEAENLLKDIRVKYETLADVALQKMKEKLKEETPTTTPTKPVDLKNMFREIKTLKKKYNMPKGVLFTPDKLEISVQRISYDNFHLSYKEFFNYLPDRLLETVILTTINFFVQTGVPRGLIKRIDENGMGLEIDGNFFVIANSILPELLIQKRFEDAEISSFLGSIEERRKMFTDFFDLEFEWNIKTEEKFYANLSTVTRIMQEHPSATTELQAIVKKYTQAEPKETN